MTTEPGHLPEIEIQRWGEVKQHHLTGYDWGFGHCDDGPYVTYADHVAALRACEARVREEAEPEWAGKLVESMAFAYRGACDDALAAVKRVYGARFVGPVPAKVRLAHSDSLVILRALKASAARRG